MAFGGSVHEEGGLTAGSEIGESFESGKRIFKSSLVLGRFDAEDKGDSLCALRGGAAGNDTFAKTYKRSGLIGRKKRRLRGK